MRSFVLLFFVGVLLSPALGQTGNEYILQVLENFKERMKTGIPEINMPVLDPLKVPIINANIKEGVADVQLKIHDLVAEGLSTYIVKDLKLDMSTMNLAVKILLPTGTAQGTYDLNGKIMRFIPLYGKGRAGLQINDLLITVNTKLDMSSGSINLQTFKIGLQFSQIQLYLENILGGGDLGDLVNHIVNAFGKKIFDSQRSNIERALNGVIRTAINKELAKLDISKFGYSALYSNANPALYQSANANDFVDKILANARPELVKYDPVNLPYLKKGFKKKVGLIPFEGYAELKNGQCHGISSLHRTGDVKLTTDVNSGSLTVTGNLGISNLRINYATKLYFLGIKAYPTLHGNIRGVSVYIKIKQNFNSGKSELLDFRIVNIYKPQLIIKNLPVLDFIATGIINAAIKPIVNSIKGNIEREVKNALAKVISKLSIKI